MPDEGHDPSFAALCAALKPVLADALLGAGAFSRLRYIPMPRGHLSRQFAALPNSKRQSLERAWADYNVSIILGLPLGDPLQKSFKEFESLTREESELQSKEEYHRISKSASMSSSLNSFDWVKVEQIISESFMREGCKFSVARPPRLFKKMFVGKSVFLSSSLYHGFDFMIVFEDRKYWLDLKCYLFGSFGEYIPIPLNWVFNSGELISSSNFAEVADDWLGSFANLVFAFCDESRKVLTARFSSRSGEHGQPSPNISNVEQKK